MRYRVAIAALMWTAASAASAATCKPGEGAASSAQLAACKSDLADTEADLTKAYRRLRVQTPMELRTSLGKAQQAWLAYRAAQCVFEGGGTPGVVNAAALSCTAAMNRDRIERLEEALIHGE